MNQANRFASLRSDILPASVATKITPATPESTKNPPPPQQASKESHDLIAPM